MKHDSTSPLRTAPMSHALARQMAGWHYGGAFAIYDHPDWEAMVARHWGLTDPAISAKEFVALLDGDRRVAGFLRFMDQADALGVGLGLRPDLCGRGLGAFVMRCVEEEALRRRGPGLLRLHVRSFNERALRCYERAGWVCVDRIRDATAQGPDEFVVMERRLRASDERAP